MRRGQCLLQRQRQQGQRDETRPFDDLHSRGTSSISRTFLESFACQISDIAIADKEELIHQTRLHFVLWGSGNNKAERFHEQYVFTQNLFSSKLTISSHCTFFFFQSHVV